MEGLIFGILRVFPRKVSNTTTRKSMFAISVRNFLACSQTLMSRRKPGLVVVVVVVVVVEFSFEKGF